MNDTPSPPDRECLFQIASEQAGHFTNAQARRCGYSRVLLSHHARRGEFLRVHRGVYRLRDYPSHPRAEVVAAWLAVGRDDSLISHESALDFLELSDVVPDSIHITVPRRRRGYRPPPGVTLHTTTRWPEDDDVLVREGVRITGPVRTVLDAAESGAAPEQVQRAARQAVDRGMTARRELLRAARERGPHAHRLIARALEETAEA